MARFSAAAKLGQSGLRRGDIIETSLQTVREVFGSTRWKIVDTGGGLRRWQVDCYYGEDEPLGPGRFMGRPRGTTPSMPTLTQKSSSDVNAFTVRLKFHDDLTFFLKSKTSDGIIERNLGEKTSVKDVIESCGVPHPEVDLILVNGKPVDFSHPIVKDADVDLYPVQSRCLLFKGQGDYKSAPIMRFVADGHLGTLARNLRLLGFDVAYDQQAQDRQLLSVMEREDRALLTRDRHLLMHAIVRHGYCPRSQNADDQTIEVVRRFDLSDSISPFIVASVAMRLSKKSLNLR